MTFTSPQRRPLSPLIQRLLGAVTLALGVSACGTIMVEHSLTGISAPTHRGEVRVVMEGGEQPTNLREIAII